jgi:hypothetical protein
LGSSASVTGSSITPGGSSTSRSSSQAVVSSSRSLQNIAAGSSAMPRDSGERGSCISSITVEPTGGFEVARYTSRFIRGPSRAAACGIEMPASE